jgi:hypothetical protein
MMGIGATGPHGERTDPLRRVLIYLSMKGMYDLTQVDARDRFNEG